MATTAKIQLTQEVLNFQPNNVRSLALSLGKRYQDSKKGWEIAKKVSETSNQDFNSSNIEDILASFTKSQSKITNSQEPKAPKGETKNDKIRKLLNSGKSISEVAKDLELTYQRVKNVVKADKKKLENK